MLANYSKLAFRNLAKNKLHNGINIIGLAVGFCCAILISLYIWNELHYDTYHQNHQRIYRLESFFNIAGQEDEFARTAFPLAPTLAEEFPEIESYARFLATGNMLFKSNSAELYEPDIYYADSDAVQIFTHNITAGDAETALSEPNTIVISQDLANRLFGDENPIGGSVKINNAEEYRITAVFENLPQNVHLFYQGLISMNSLLSLMGEEQYYSREPVMFWNINPFSYILLKEESNIQSILSRFPLFYNTYMKSIGDQLHAEFRLMATPLRKIHHYSKLQWDLSTGNIAYVYIFALIALFILAIACINYMNIATARSTHRAREVGMRKVFGANQPQLIRQFLLESVFLAFIALLIAIAVSELVLPYFNIISGKNLIVSMSDLYVIYGAFLLIAVFVGFAAGIYPAYYLSSFVPEKVLKRSFGSGKGSGLLRKILVLVQFAISLIMISGTIVVYLQLQYFRERDIGFNKENIVAVTLRDTTALAKKNVFKERLLEQTNIEKVAASTYIPGSGVGKIVMKIEKDNEMKEQAINFFFVDADFLELMQINIVEGRNFNRDMETDFTQAFIVNQAAAVKFGWLEETLGKRIQFGIDLEGNAAMDGPVVGVVQDFFFHSLHTPIEPYIIMLRRDSLPFVSIRLKNRLLPETINAIKQVWAEIHPDYPIEYHILDDRIANFYDEEKNIALLIRYFAIICILIACMGLFGLATYTAEQKTKEIGIRKVFGASIFNIIVHLSREFLLWVLMANFIAIPVAYLLLKHWLDNFAYYIPIPAYVFVISACLAIFIAIATVLYQALKAALSNPINALTYE